MDCDRGAGGRRSDPPEPAEGDECTVSLTTALHRQHRVAHWTTGDVQARPVNSTFLKPLL